MVPVLLRASGGPQTTDFDRHKAGQTFKTLILPRTLRYRRTMPFVLARISVFRLPTAFRETVLRYAHSDVHFKPF